MIVTGLILLLLGALAAANGANDVSTGVATLAGSGVTRYRTAIVGGGFTPLGGALVSGVFAERMIKLFTSGIVSARPTSAFTLAVICGTVGWVAIATLTRLPVSTTHAIIGSLLGAGLLFAPNMIAWSILVPRLVVPLMLSIAVSYALSARYIRPNSPLSTRCSTPSLASSTPKAAMPYSSCTGVSSSGGPVPVPSSQRSV